ncbi:MAG: bifunctional riboflavin kinase/FAD synthetase [Clostridia bacterium]|nr:bifunctional riboflavin kinase/FAD synthetase [Clostridia bacterium]
MKQHRSVLALGMFDGVHVGHQALVRQAVQAARALDAQTVAFTFTDAPGKLLHLPVTSLSTPDQRTRWLKEAGADRVDMVDFTRAFADLSPEGFLDYLQDRYDVAGLAAGFNYTFGKFGAGTARTLKELGERHGFQVFIAEPVLLDGEPVSSTRIRTLVNEGQMERAGALLGRPYTLSGPVVSARRIGHRLGYPTANVEAGEQLLPPDGVYATYALADGVAYPAVTNVGRNPTVAGKQRTVETYILNEELSLYGTDLSVSFLSRLREERTFPTLEALSEQIGRDVQTAKKLFDSAKKTVYNQQGL